MNDSYNSLEDITRPIRNKLLCDVENSFNSSRDLSKTADLSLSEHLMGFENLRISALTKAAKISPYIKEVTIGPNSPEKKDVVKEVLTPSNKDKPVKNLMEDKLQDDLRYTLVMKEYNNKLHETSEAIYKNLVEKMIARRAETMQQFWKKQHEECERKAKELREKKLQLLKELQENESLALYKSQINEQSSQIINQQTLENMNRILEEQNKATTRFATITDCHTKICIIYNEITTLMQTEPLAKSVCEKYISSLNNTMGSINVIMEYCKTGTLTDQNVRQAEVLVRNMENLKTKIKDDLAAAMLQEKKMKQKKKEEELKRAELERIALLAAESAKLESKTQVTALSKADSPAKVTKSIPMFYSQNNYAHYEEIINYLNSYESQYKDLLENVSFKKFRFECQKAVNTPVNALSSVSGIHMRDKFDKLLKLLKGERVQVLDSFVNASQHPQGVQYCTALLAKKIVRQGELLVSSNPEAAFPLAAVTVALCSQCPDFDRLLEAYFYKFCPYIVPMFLPQKQGQTDKEFYLSRGYTYNEDGVVEKQDKFLKRMSGIFTLKCAIWVANLPRFINSSNPQGPKYGWRWLASFINLKPEPDICATLLLDFFTTCGSQFYKYYGRQFTKIIKLISTDYLLALEKIDEGGPKTRLEVFLQNVIKAGSIPPPTGLLPPNTW